MDHDQAIQTQASTRYILGELLPAERDSFEEHYADCSHCLNDVELAAAFAANSKEVFRERALAGNAPKGIPWFTWRPFPALALSAALNLILVAGLGIGFLRLRQTAPTDVVTVSQPESATMSDPESVDIISVRGTTRSAENAQAVRASIQPVFLKFNLLQHYDHYFYSVERAGSVVKSGELNRPSGDALILRIPVDRLSPGDYQVSVTGHAVGAAGDNLGNCVLQVERR
jgi:hypothetical protein